MWPAESPSRVARKPAPSASVTTAAVLGTGRDRQPNHHQRNCGQPHHASILLLSFYDGRPFGIVSKSWQPMRVVKL